MGINQLGNVSFRLLGASGGSGNVADVAVSNAFVRDYLPDEQLFGVFVVTKTSKSLSDCAFDNSLTNIGLLGLVKLAVSTNLILIRHQVGIVHLGV